jgi:hypothetical protein
LSALRESCGNKMANCSDAFGTIRVERVGREFLEFLTIVQGDDSDAYYTLVDREDIRSAKPDKDGNLEFPFSTSGRWAYQNNIEGYLKGGWMNEGEKQGKAYSQFIAALKTKNGLVEIDYTDSDTAMDWMGTGGVSMSVEDGEVSFAEGFEEESITITGFAELQGESEEWALEYLYGEDVSEKYEKYLDDWREGHKAPEFKGMEPASPDEWYTNEYKEEE